MKNSVNREQFIPGSIHKKEVYEFWREELRASDWVLKTLRDGYSIPFNEEPEPYQEKNNKSARDNMEIVREIVLEMIDLGIVQTTVSQPYCASPLGLVSKMKGGKLKHRLVWDASRHLNNILEKQRVKLTHLEKALEITNQNDFQVVFDLKSAYYNIKIAEDQWKFLGATISDSDGKDLHFVYKHLPFGLSSAVHAITKLWKPLVAYFTMKGIRFSIYIDDGRILAQTREEAVQAMRFVYSTIKKAGWTLEHEKSDKEEDISQIKEYLGFKINTLSMRVFATEEKIDKIKELISEALRCDSLPPKVLARVLGKIISLKPSHGSSVLICTKSSYVCLEKTVQERGWRSNNGIVLSEESKRELHFFLDNIDILNGHIIQSEARAIRVDTIIPNPICKREKIHFFEGPVEKIIVSDASETKVFVYDLINNGETILSVNLSHDEKSLSSGHRELLAIQKTLEHWTVTNYPRGLKLFWITDSENVVSFINKGSNKPHVQRAIFKTLLLSRQLDIKIIPIHLRRSDPRIQLADLGSKTKNTDNWSMDNTNFSALNEIFHFDFDLFADSLNKKVPRFASLFFEEGCEFVDAFSMNWANLGMLWVCPPINDLIQVARRIRSSQCKGVVMFPVWPTSNFFHFFMENMSKTKPPFILEKIFNPYIFQNEDAKNTPLFGYTNFSFVILSFNTFIF